MAPLRTAVQIALVAGLLLGAWHLWLAAGAIFVFRNGEPLWSWFAVLLGPGLTLVAVLIAIFKVRIGAFALMAGGCLSLLAFAIGVGPEYSSVVPFLLCISLPMVAVGISLLVTSRPTHKLSPTVSASNAA